MVKPTRRIHRVSCNHKVIIFYFMGLGLITWTKGILYSRNLHGSKVLYQQPIQKIFASVLRGVSLEHRSIPWFYPKLVTFQSQFSIFSFRATSMSVDSNSGAGSPLHIRQNFLYLASWSGIKVKLFKNGQLIWLYLMDLIFQLPQAPSLLTGQIIENEQVLRELVFVNWIILPQGTLYYLCDQHSCGVYAIGVPRALNITVDLQRKEFHHPCECQTLDLTVGLKRKL